MATPPSPCSQSEQEGNRGEQCKVSPKSPAAARLRFSRQNNATQVVTTSEKHKTGTPQQHLGSCLIFPPPRPQNGQTTVHESAGGGQQRHQMYLTIHTSHRAASCQKPTPTNISAQKKLMASTPQLPLQRNIPGSTTLPSVLPSHCLPTDTDAARCLLCNDFGYYRFNSWYFRLKLYAVTNIDTTLL